MLRCSRNLEAPQKPSSGFEQDLGGISMPAGSAWADNRHRAGRVMKHGQADQHHLGQATAITRAHYQQVTARRGRASRASGRRARRDDPRHTVSSRLPSSRSDGVMSGIGDTTRRSGLANLRHRAEALGGKLLLGQAEGEGTRLEWQVRLPTPG